MITKLYLARDEIPQLVLWGAGTTYDAESRQQCWGCYDLGNEASYSWLRTMNIIRYNIPEIPMSYIDCSSSQSFNGPASHFVLNDKWCLAMVLNYSDEKNKLCKAGMGQRDSSTWATSYGLGFTMPSFAIGFIWNREADGNRNRTCLKLLNNFSLS